MSLRILAITIALSIPVSGSHASADAPDEATRATSSAQPREDEDEDEESTRWQWRRFQQAEGVVTLVAMATGVGLVFAQPDVGVLWTGTLPLDQEIREGLRLRSADDRETAALISDIALAVFLAGPLVEPLFLAGVAHGEWDSALQMTLINAEVIALAFAVAELTTRLTGRARPNDLGCHLVPAGEPGACADGIGHHTSFVGGHSIVMFASASVTCAHHLENPWLTGGVESAALVCGSGLVLATAASALRVMSDLHWASDIVVGASLGALIGLAVPYVLHYLQPIPTGTMPGAHMGIVPRIDAHERGIGVLGTF